ncbi:4-alpha-glucanotransferase [Ferruginibacter sp. SUN002]|uniref:4-alpha-glucanotransferase n=1 Tax=Ferruginibacter sp. SUN002 TaxID=2937789 RepID=UPI003D36C0E9
MIVNFYLRYSTKYGQRLYVSGDCDALGNNNISKAIPLYFFNEELWLAKVDLSEKDIAKGSLQYKFIYRDNTGAEIIEWGDDRIIDVSKTTIKEITTIDFWNHAGQVENAFFTQPFQEVLLKTLSTAKVATVKSYTHELKVKAPLLKEDEVICVIGSNDTLGNWKTDKPLLLNKSGNWWSVKIDLADESFPVLYKYAVYGITDKKVRFFEAGGNRAMQGGTGKGKLTILHDGFAQLPFPNWKGAGVAIPVFSLRTTKSFGTGEFTDIRQLVDWSKLNGLKLIQLLPVNDTTATHTWMDSYPYAAISAFALHPLFINLEKVAGEINADVVKALSADQKRLNVLPAVDYDAVMAIKFAALKKLYNLQKREFLKDPGFKAFFDSNKHWLIPYAAFCYLRDKYGVSDYSKWPTNSIYSKNEIEQLAASSEKHYDEIALHYFIQYHLHIQLKEATAYAHENGIIVKGDLPIGIYRYGCDAWMAPELYNMDAQAGAPPDDFAIKGQNWGFPTYNWKKMQEDGFAWWRQRFHQMSEYFDAFRIDHILGFFRIWSIPVHAVEGIMGKFVPAIPVHISEFHQNNISIDHYRYCAPFINDSVLYEVFGYDVHYVKDNFLNNYDGNYHLKEEFNTQRKVEQYFAGQPNDDFQHKIKYGLFDLISNIILIEEEGSGGQQFHFRINADQTSSFRYLDGHTQSKLKELYVNYFYSRQDDFWKKEALHKLPELKRSTNMLVCGEDLGMVPDCVPDVMQQLGMLSLEIQRMPKDSTKEFFHPADAPYLSVVTPSTHDMSTIRGWWEEDAVKTQRFYNNELGHYGGAPYFCDAWINKEIVVQHLFSPAMWSIFQLQDILGINDKLRRDNPNDERINVPANPKHYWQYRMHMTFEDLIKETEFNTEFGGLVKASGR